MPNAHLCARVRLSYLMEEVGQSAQSRSFFSMLLDLIGRMDRSLVAALSIRLASSRAKSVIRMSGGISLAAFMRLASAAIHGEPAAP